MSDIEQLKERLDWRNQPDRASMRAESGWSVVYQHIQHALSKKIAVEIPIGVEASK